MEEIISLLEKFKSLEVLKHEGSTDVDEYKVTMTILDAEVMQTVLNVFLYGSWKWKCELGVMLVETGAKPVLNCYLDKDAFDGDEADLIREVDYKRCLLKNAVSRGELLK